MSSEKNNDTTTLDAAFRLLCLNHTMLSYISALGAHREKLEDAETLSLLDDAVCCVDGALHHLPAESGRIQQALENLSARIQMRTPDSDSKEQLVLQQIGLLVAHLPELTSLNSKILPAHNPV